MKRKILSSLLAVTIACSVIACGSKNVEVTPSIEAEPITTETPATTEAPSATEAPVTDNEATGETAGEILLGIFNETLAADPSASPATIAEAVLAHPSIQFMSGSMPVEPGLLMGFGDENKEVEITGFEEGVQFGPMMGSIPFIGYIFTLPEDADQAAFMETLKDGANLRWQICVEAEQLIVEANGNKVFFLMCKNSLDQE